MKNNSAGVAALRKEYAVRKRLYVFCLIAALAAAGCSSQQPVPVATRVLPTIAPQSSGITLSMREIPQGTNKSFDMGTVPYGPMSVQVFAQLNPPAANLTIGSQSFTINIGDKICFTPHGGSITIGNEKINDGEEICLYVDKNGGFSA